MIKRNASSNAALILVFVLVVSIASYTQNQVLGEVQFVTKTKTAKTSGVWIDGQYVGYAAELKDDKKVLLLPGEHEISVRQSAQVGRSGETRSTSSPLRRSSALPK